MKQRTFYIGLFALLITMLFTACRKSTGSGGSDYYVQFDLDGVTTRYTVDDYGSQTYDAGRTLYTGLILGYRDANSGLRNALDITILSQQSLANGENFHDPLKSRAANGDELPQLIVTYYDNAANGFVSAGLIAVGPGGTVPIPGVVADAQVTITDFTATSIKGSFSATVYKSGDVTFQSRHKLTNGSFYVKRLK